MNRNRLIFFIVFGAFHLGAFVFTVWLEKDTGLLFKMVSYVPTFKWITLFGLLLLITDVLWSFMLDRTGTRDKAALNKELNSLKAKLFDYQEAAKKQTTVTETKK